MITVERAKMILASYGGDTSLWPENERAEMEALLVNSSSLRALQLEALSLDQLINIPLDQQNNKQHYQQLIAQTILSLPEQEHKKRTLFFSLRTYFAHLRNNLLEFSVVMNPLAISFSIFLSVLSLFSHF